MCQVDYVFSACLDVIVNFKTVPVNNLYPTVKTNANIADMASVGTKESNSLFRPANKLVNRCTSTNTFQWYHHCRGLFLRVLVEWLCSHCWKCFYVGHHHPKTLQQLYIAFRRASGYLRVFFGSFLRQHIYTTLDINISNTFDLAVPCFTMVGICKDFHRSQCCWST